MISSFDDYMIHQNAEPVNQPGPSDRNFYDRYWFSGFDAEGEFIFEVGFGLYPNRQVMAVWSQPARPLMTACPQRAWVG